MLLGLVGGGLGEGEEEVKAENRHPAEHRDAEEVEAVAQRQAASLGYL